MSEFRLLRVGEQIRSEISTMILTGVVKDPRVTTFLSVNRVELSADLGYAKVYVSSFMSPKKTESGVAGLQCAAGFIQTTLSKKLHLRQFPKLTFVVDESIKEGIAMVKLIEEITASSASQSESVVVESSNPS
jgi:ribosome-binding factor A